MSWWDSESVYRLMLVNRDAKVHIVHRRLQNVFSLPKKSVTMLFKNRRVWLNLTLLIDQSELTIDDKRILTTLDFDTVKVS